MSNDFYNFNTETGVITAKDTSVVKQAVKDDLTTALGATDFSASTPMGRLVEWLTIFGANVLKLNMQNSNQLLISAAAGQQLDALALLFGLRRKAATKTTVEATLTGTASTTIASGTRAKSEQGDVYELTSAVTLDASGSGTGKFACTEYGKVYCEKEELKYIETPVAGWDAVINETAGSIGTEVETDDELRTRIQESRYSGSGFIGAIKNALENIDGVKSSMVVENNTNESMTVGGVDSVSPHSIFVCVDCEDNPDVYNLVGKALYLHKPCGTGYTRYSSLSDSYEKDVEIKDDYDNIYHTYFYIPEAHVAALRLKVHNRSYAGVDIASDVKDAIVTLWQKQYKVGETVYVSDISRAVEELVPGVIVLSGVVNNGGTSESQFGTATYLEIPACAKAIFSSSEITVEEIK